MTDKDCFPLMSPWPAATGGLTACTRLCPLPVTQALSSSLHHSLNQMAHSSQNRQMSCGVLTEQGCVFQERHGWERPAWFNWDGAAPVRQTSFTLSSADRNARSYSLIILDQHGVSMFDMSYLGKFYLTGPDAKKAADWLFSADVKKAAGYTVYTCMLNKRGGYEADLTVSRLEAGTANLCLAPDSNGKSWEAIFRNNVPVGHLRCANYGFFIDKQIGYGYIRNPDRRVVSNV